MPTPSTTTYQCGELLLVRFVFADELGAKRRPVLVLSSPEYHAARQEIIVAAVTSNVVRVLPGDCPVKYWQSACLPKPSLVTAILRTIKRSMVEGSFGSLTASDLSSVQTRLRGVLPL